MWRERYDLPKRYTIMIFACGQGLTIAAHARGLEETRSGGGK